MRFCQPTREKENCTFYMDDIVDKVDCICFLNIIKADTVDYTLLLNYLLLRVMFIIGQINVSRILQRGTDS